MVPVSNSEPLHDVPEERMTDLSVSLESLTEPLSAIAFWMAIAIPALYVPLIATGIEGLDGLGLFFGLFALHLVSLYVGRSYRRDDDPVR